VFPGQRAAVRPVPTTGVTGVRVLSATEAAQLLQQIAVPGERGEAVKAWVWDDRGGSNVLMLTEDVASRHPGGVARWGSLHAWVVRGRGTPAQEDRAVTTVTLGQADIPGGCPKGSDGVLGFVEPPQVVRDVDGDGYAEVFMGSFAYCTASPPARVRLDVEPGRPSSRSSLNVDGDGVPKALPAAVAALGLLPEAGADVEPVIPHTSGRLWPGSLEQVSRDVFLEMFR
jgi:hypothetical protein